MVRVTLTKIYLRTPFGLNRSPLSTNFLLKIQIKIIMNYKESVYCKHSFESSLVRIVENLMPNRDIDTPGTRQLETQPSCEETQEESSRIGPKYVVANGVERKGKRNYCDVNGSVHPNDIQSSR
ncbi:hypothetical protein TNCV_1894591 [Trichonephila clavipes]|nr:hypothetical protein TNCV_1894591 [Trichonephila clavipes]